MDTSANLPALEDIHHATKIGLKPRTNSGELAGFRNLLSKEMGEWFGTRRWIWQALIWMVMINGFIAFLLFVLPTIEPLEEGGTIPPPNLMAWTLYFSFVTVAGSIGMIILAQDEIIQEKQSGTAAWILSKPVARPAFVLAKWISNVIGGLLFIVAIPAVISVVEVSLTGEPGIPVLQLLAAIGIAALALVFYLSLVIFLGVMFDQRGPVLGIAFAVMFGGMLIGQLLPQLGYVLPLQMDQAALALSQGQPLAGMAVSQVITTAVWSVFFLVAALVRFRRVEF